MAQFIHVQSVAPLDDRIVRIVFTNGEQRDVEGSTIVWPNGADIDPDVLYYGGPLPWSAEYTINAVARR